MSVALGTSTLRFNAILHICASEGAWYSLYTDPAGVTKEEGQVLLPGIRQNANTITANGLNLVNPIY